MFTHLFNPNFGQTKYQDVDELISADSMIDAMSAITILKEEHQKDTTDSQYWLRYSKASYIFYNYDDAKSSINKAIKSSPNNALFYFEKGLLLNRIGDTKDALAPLEKAVSLNPDGEYFYWKGIVNHQLKNLKEAETDYKKAIEKKHKSPELYNNLAILLSENEKYEDALKAISKAIALRNKYPEAYSARSKINFFLLKTDSACKDRSTALQMGYAQAFEIPDSICNGSDTEKIKYSGDFFANFKFYDLGIKAYSKLIQTKELQSDFLLNRGYCYYKLKDYKNAEKDYLKALELPNAVLDLLYENLSILYYDQNNFDESLLYSSKRLKLNPANHVPYIDRGLCYRKLRKYKEAEKDFNKSLELKPDFFRAYGYRSFLFLELGDYKKSYDDALRSIEINPQYGYGYVVLGQSKQYLGMPDYCLDFLNAKKYGAPDAEIAFDRSCK